MVTGRASSDRVCTACSRRMSWRVNAIEACTLLCSSWWNCGLPSLTSTESRMATTVAERGSSVYRLISPMIWPRAISRTMCSTPSSSRT